MDKRPDENRKARWGLWKLESHRTGTMNGSKAILIASILAQTGCGTVTTKRAGQWGEEYSGVPCSVKNSQMVLGVAPAPVGLVLFPFFLVDTVMSGVLDTILLPIDLPMKAPKERGKGCLIGIGD